MIIPDRQEPLNALYGRLFPTPIPAAAVPRRPPPGPAEPDDEDRFRVMFGSKQGPEIRALWDGKTGAYDGDESRADCALCAHIAFYWGDDPDVIDRIFRRSGLYRAKWDREDYRGRTIARATAGMTEFYSTRSRPANSRVRHASNGRKAVASVRRQEPPSKPPVHDAEPEPEPEPARLLPAIRADDGNLPRATSLAWAALLAANNPPVLFRSASVPSRLVRDEQGRCSLEALTVDRMRHHLARAANFYREVKAREGEGEVRVPAHPPLAVVKDLLATPEVELPAVSRIVNAPVFGPSGVLQTTPGYHPDGRTYYDPSPGFTVPEVPLAPTRSDIERARALIETELLGDFPFTGDSERAHAVALLLLPFARSLIAGLTPLHLIEKPEAGTGAGLLVEVALSPALGAGPAAMAAGRDQDEWRKRITSTLMRAPAAVLIDNLKHTLDSDVLAAVLTATDGWEDRILGHSENVHLSVECVWVATANNPTLSKEMTRRRIRIRMDAGVEHPELRTGFRHPDLSAWAKEHRSELVWAALTLIQAWLAAGRPRGDRALGRLEQWSWVMGGILKVAGISGFLENLDEANASSDAESLTDRAFVWAWFEAHGEREATAGDLWPVATAADVTLNLGDGGEQSQRTRLGRLISRLRDRRFVFEGPAAAATDRLTLTVRRAGGVKHGAVTWRLEVENLPSGEGEPPLPSKASVSDTSSRTAQTGLWEGRFSAQRGGSSAPTSPPAGDPYSHEEDPLGEVGEVGEVFPGLRTCDRAHTSAPAGMRVGETTSPTSQPPLPADDLKTRVWKTAQALGWPRIDVPDWGETVSWHGFVDAATDEQKAAALVLLDEQKGEVE